jgi:uncharacterized protein
MVLHLTYACNIRCHYCYVEKDAHHIPMDEARRSIDFFVDKLASGPDSTLFFMGGEPLAVPDLLKEVVEYAKSRGVRSFGVISNGTLLDDRWLDYLAANRFYLHLSLDGVKETQDANRPLLGGGGSFEKADRALDLLGGRVKELQHFEIRHTFTPETLPRLADSVAYYASKPCAEAARVCLMPAMLPTGRWQPLLSSGRLVPALREQMGRIAELYLERRRAGRRLNLYYNECLSDTAPLSEETRPESYSCRAGEITFTINMKGEIFPCHAPAPHPEHRDNADYILGDTRNGLTRPEKAAAYLGGDSNVHHSCPHWNRFESGDPSKPAGVYTAFYAAWLDAVRRLREAAAA